MADATSLPTSTQLHYFDWGDVHFTKNPAIDGSGTYTLEWSKQPLDKDGAIITGAFLVTSTARSGEPYTFFVPAAKVSADGLSATECVGGIRPTGLDYTTGDSDFEPTSDTILSGRKITCGIPATLVELIRSSVQGGIRTGGVTFDIGTGATEDVYIKHNGSPWLKQTSAGVAQYYNGSSYVNLSDTQSSVTQKVSSADTTADYLYNKIDVSTEGELTKAIGSPAGDEKLQLGLATTLTKAEMDALHTGISANVTGTNLATLTGGTSSNADALHTHASSPILSGTAGEAINGSSTPVVVARMMNAYKDYVFVQTATNKPLIAAGTTAVPLGNVDANTWCAISFSYTDSLAASIKLDSINFAASRSGSPGGNLTVEVQTDSSGSPSGTVVTNGTSATFDPSSGLTTSQETRQITWSTSPTLTSGTTYWLVFKRSVAVDPANYINLYRNSDVSGYVTKTYTASSTTWSSALAADLDLGFVFSIDYDGKIVKASNTDLKRANVVGVTKDNVAAGATISYYGKGATVSGFSGLTENLSYYADASGAYSASPTINMPSAANNTNKAIMLKAFTAVSSTSVQVDTSESIVIISLGDSNVAGAAVAAAAVNLDFPVSCGFQPETITVHRVAGSSTIAETIKFIRTTPYIELTAWSAVGSTYYSIASILENGATLRVAQDVVDNTQFGGIMIFRKA